MFPDVFHEIDGFRQYSFYAIYTQPDYGQDGKKHEVKKKKKFHVKPSHYKAVSQLPPSPPTQEVYNQERETKEKDKDKENRYNEILLRWTVPPWRHLRDFAKVGDLPRPHSQGGGAGGLCLQSPYLVTYISILIFHVLSYILKVFIKKK